VRYITRFRREPVQRQHNGEFPSVGDPVRDHSQMLIFGSQAHLQKPCHGPWTLGRPCGTGPEILKDMLSKSRGDSLAEGTKSPHTEAFRRRLGGIRGAVAWERRRTVGRRPCVQGVKQAARRRLPGKQLSKRMRVPKGQGRHDRQSDGEMPQHHPSKSATSSRSLPEHQPSKAPCGGGRLWSLRRRFSQSSQCASSNFPGER
jgi:hypothetical protein